MTFGQRIQQYRKEKGLSQDKLASTLYVTRQSVSQWENDKTMPSVDLLVKLSEVFGVSVDTLLGKEEEQPVREPVATTPVISDRKRLRQCAGNEFRATSTTLGTIAICVFFYLFLVSRIYPPALSGIRTNLDYSGFIWQFVAASLLLATTCGFIIYRMVLYRRDLKNSPSLSNCTLQFFDDCFVLHDGSETPLSFYYTRLKRVMETDNFIVITMDDKRRICVDKHNIDGDRERLYTLLKGCKRYRRRLRVWGGKRDISERTQAVLGYTVNILFIAVLFMYWYEAVAHMRIITDGSIPTTMRWCIILLPYIITVGTLITGVILTLRKVKALRLIFAGAAITVAALYATFATTALPLFTLQQHRVMPDEFVSAMKSQGMKVEKANQGRTERLLMDCYRATSPEHGFTIEYYNFLDESEHEGQFYAWELYNKLASDNEIRARQIKNKSSLDVVFNRYLTVETEVKYCYLSLNRYTVIYVMTDLENKENVAKVLEQYRMPLPY